MILDSRGRLLGKVNLLDLLAFLFVLSLSTTVGYALLVSRHQSLEVVSIEPRRIVAGPHRYVMMKGTGFDQSTTMEIGHYRVRSGVCFDESTIGAFINEEIGPGIYRVVVRDGRGRTVILKDAFEVIWEPKISKVKPRMIYSSGPGSRIEIHGAFFTPSCSVHVGGKELLIVERVTPGRIVAGLAKDSGESLALGEQPVTVTNEGGQSLTLEGALTVLPTPRILNVRPRRVYDTGARIEISGEHFQNPCFIDIGGHRVQDPETQSPELIVVAPDRNARLPVGEQPVTVTDAEGRSVTVDGALTVLPTPEITAVQPRVIEAIGPVELEVHGRHFRPGASAELISAQSETFPLGQVTYVNPECLRVHLPAGGYPKGPYALRLKAQDVPQEVVLSRAVEMLTEIPVFVVVGFALDDDVSEEQLQILYRRPEWRLRRFQKLNVSWKRRNFNVDRAIEVVIPAELEIHGDSREYKYHGIPLDIGRWIPVVVEGQVLTGKIATRPVGVLLDDRFLDRER